MSQNTKPKSRREDIVIQEVDGEILIYDLRINKAYCLNRTSALVWQACDGSRTIAEINDFVGRQLKASSNDDVIWLALDQLSRENLLADPVPRAFGVSRREALKRIGVTSAVALPVIASLVAPKAVSAQSCRANDAVCTTSSQCCSNCCKAGGGGVNQCKSGGGNCLP